MTRIAKSKSTCRVPVGLCVKHWMFFVQAMKEDSDPEERLETYEVSKHNWIGFPM